MKHAVRATVAASATQASCAIFVLGCFVSLALLFFTQAAAAAPCTSPDLAPGFCDRNGDMLADPPEDKTQWLDPDPIIVGDVPTTDMTARSERIAPFLRHLEKALGRKVTYFVAKDYSDLLAAYKANRVHIVNINTGSVEKEVRCHGYVTIAQPVDAKGNIDGSTMELIVPTQSTIKTPRDLKGRKITFVDESSNSGYKTPRAILAKEFGLEAGKDYNFDFSGRHDNSVMGITNGVYEAAATGSAVRINMLRDKLIDASALRVIYASKTFPNSPWGVSYRLNPALTTRLQNAIVTYSGPENALQYGNRFKAANYKSDWAFIRELSAASGVPVVCK